MQAKIISLNSGDPAPMEWEGRSIVSSMHRHPVQGPLVVHKLHIEGSTFGSPALHGIEHSVLYAYGAKSALTCMEILGRTSYEPGALGENVTLEDFDEAAISVGDVFEFGSVLAQAVYPRIPCSKVNFRMQHKGGQKALEDCGRSGVYFRVLQPGKIHLTDTVRLVEPAVHRFTIFELYKKMIAKAVLTEAEMSLAVANGAFPEKALSKWRAQLAKSRA